MIQLARGISNHRGAWRDISGDDAAGTDHGVGADRDPSQNGGTGANRCALLHQRSQASPIALLDHPAILRHGSRPTVVDKHHTMPDKYLVLDSHTLANK